MAVVNPPPIPRIPKQFLNDAQTRGFFQELQKILFQLWVKTGGGEDLVDVVLEEVSSNDNQISLNYGLIQHLRQRIEDLESDHSPQMRFAARWNDISKNNNYTLADWDDVSASGTIRLKLPLSPTPEAEYIIGNDDGKVKTIDGNGKKIRRKSSTNTLTSIRRGSRVHLRYKIDIDEYVLI